jgi:hypothetical protein
LRSGLVVAGNVGLPAPHDTTLLAELPDEVSVGWPVVRLTSHAWPVAGSTTVRTQPGFGLRHQRTRVSAPLAVGVAGNTAHCGLSESKSTLSSRTSTPPVRAST